MCRKHVIVNSTHPHWSGVKGANGPLSWPSRKLYVQGVSTRKVAKITAELCGLEVTSTQVSRAAALLDKELKAWRNRPIDQVEYLILDARYEKVRIDGSVRDCAVLVAIGVLPSGHRSVPRRECVVVRSRSALARFSSVAKETRHARNETCRQRRPRRTQGGTQSHHARCRLATVPVSPHAKRNAVHPES